MQLVEALARGKCLSVSAQHPGAVVIGCDTVVELDGRVFGKPHSTDEAVQMLRALSGRVHRVHTGVCVSDGSRTESFVDSCQVAFFPISEEEIARYAATEEPYDKAGAYGHRAMQPCGWTASKGIIIRSWGCRSAARCVWWSILPRNSPNKDEK